MGWDFTGCLQVKGYKCDMHSFSCLWHIYLMLPRDEYAIITTTMLLLIPQEFGFYLIIIILNSQKQVM